VDDPIIAQATKLRDGLLSAAKEFRYIGARSTRAATQELTEHDAKTCEDAAKMLRKLGIEVTRLRLAIGHYSYGKLSRADLISMVGNWNDESSK
jgi:hypothetical protein